MKQGPPPRRRIDAFTLLEVLAASAVLALVLVVLLSFVSQTSNLLRNTNARIEAFQGARRGFENLTRALEQATLNTYWDYDDPNNPRKYIRQSQLHFFVAAAGEGGLPGTPGTGQAVFFQTPANATAEAEYDGLTGLLNAVGFFVQYGSDADWLPAHVGADQARSRYRLMEWMQETEALKVYEAAGRAWIPADAVSRATPVAENVIALAIWPREEGAPSLLDAWSYDSRNDSRAVAINQLPPVLQVAMVAMDETTAARLGGGLESIVSGCLAGLFGSAPSTGFAADIGTLEERLTAKGIPYRVFSSAIPMREAKWSP